MQRVLSLAVIGILIGCLCFAGCTSNSDNQSSDATPGEKIFISGAFALYPMMIAWTEEYQKIHPEVTFEISAGGAGKGMTDTLSGMVDIGMISRDIHDDEEAQGARWVSVAQDAVVGTMNADNPLRDQILSRGMTQAELSQIFLNNSVKNWNDLSSMTPGTSKINVYTRSDACGAADVWAAFFDAYQEDLKGTGVFGDPGLAEAVRADPLGIGYNNIGYAYDNSTDKPVAGIAVIPLDKNENGKIDPEEDFYADRKTMIAAIADGKYPAPPSRFLNIAVKDEFKGPVKEFVSWILTDGQKMTEGNGYISLSPEMQKEGLAALETAS